MNQKLTAKEQHLIFSVSLSSPGDYYEFTVDAVNTGTIDAMVDSVVKTELNEEVLNYITYEVSYSDESEINKGDLLKANSHTTYKVYVKYKDNIDSLPEENIDLTLSFSVIYVQSDIEKPVESKFIQKVKDKALSDASLDFTKISGSGLYVRSGTENNTYPIYYYRGSVANNNALFAGYCWKIVRTTETGGTKLIYNGTPNTSGQCTNTTGNSTQLSSNNYKYNNQSSSLAYAGYMYGEVYGYSVQSNQSSYLFGNTFTYNDGSYTLSNTYNDYDSTHHYTCFNSSGKCTSLSYVYYTSSATAYYYYINLTDGNSVEDAIEQMYTNTTDSNAKTTIDNWFQNTFNKYFTDRNKNYNKYLEDTVFCNDRSMNTIVAPAPIGTGTSVVYNSWIPNGGGTRDYLRYGIFGRMAKGLPTFTCSNKNNSFTVSETIGNGALTYPVGLLTADEIVFAGGQASSVASENTSYYLYTNRDFWSMSPSYYNEFAADLYEIIVDSNGVMSNRAVYNYFGLRPVISIKPGVKIKDGTNGTSTNPYEFIVE